MSCLRIITWNHFRHEEILLLPAAAYSCPRIASVSAFLPNRPLNFLISVSISFISCKLRCTSCGGAQLCQAWRGAHHSGARAPSLGRRHRRTSAAAHATSCCLCRRRIRRPTSTLLGQARSLNSTPLATPPRPAASCQAARRPLRFVMTPTGRAMRARPGAPSASCGRRRGCGSVPDPHKSARCRREAAQTGQRLVSSSFSPSSAAAAALTPQQAKLVTRSAAWPPGVLTRRRSVVLHIACPAASVSGALHRAEEARPVAAGVYRRKSLRFGQEAGAGLPATRLPPA